MPETIPDYDELQIRIEKSRGKTYSVMAIAPDGGTAKGSFTIPFQKFELELFVERVGRTRRGTRSFGSSQMEEARRFGRTLFDALLKGDVRDVYQTARGTAEAEDRGLRLTLYLSSVPELMDIPWEFLYERPSFLSQSIYTPLVRSLDLKNVRKPRRVALPLRVLGIVSRPAGYETLDVATERAKLEEALRPLVSEGRVEVVWLEGATMSEIERVVGAPDEFHVIHYIGHGAYVEDTGTGVLVLEDENGQPYHATGDDLCALIQDERSLRLVVLNSCEGARTSKVDPFSGVAAGLLSCGIPAVIGMQFEITDDAAIRFGGRFYSALAQGYPVDAALAQARKGVFAAGNDIEFATPVLFLRGANAQLFEIESGPEAAAPEPAACDMSLELERLSVPRPGQARWQLTIDNCGASDLLGVTARREDGSPLADPTDLGLGRRQLIRWTDPEAGHVITVVASAPDGSRITEQVSATTGAKGNEAEAAGDGTTAQVADVTSEVEEAAERGAALAEPADQIPESSHGAADDEEAIAQRNRGLLESSRAGFEGGLFDPQFQALSDAVTGGESLLALCRCSRPQDLLRHVALLITTEKLVWARQGKHYVVRYGTAAFNQVTGLDRLAQGGEGGHGLRLAMADGQVLAFDDFTGTGMRLGETEIEFTAAGIHRLVAALVEGAGGSTEPIPEATVEASLPRTEEDWREANRARLLEMEELFENGFYDAQRNHLLELVTGRDLLIGMLRCARKGQFFRSVALVLSSDQLFWCRESAFSGAQPGQVAWREVAKVSLEGTRLEVVTASGETYGFEQIQGRGVQLSPQAVDFSVQGVAALATRLWREATSSAPVLPR